MQVITVGIVTRDRPEALLRCLLSLSTIQSRIAEVIVVDDGSATGIAASIAKARDHLSTPIRSIVYPKSRGVTVGRNEVVRSARSDFILQLDDDAFILNAHAIELGIEVLEMDASVAAVAFAQANADGTRWPDSMQPARVASPSVIGAFTGFAALLRREHFLAADGYRESLEFYGEEKELCLRLMDDGLKIVFLPDAIVGHAPDEAGRDRSRYLRHVIRNDCLGDLYNWPADYALLRLGAHLAAYFRMRDRMGISDPKGFRWILAELVRLRKDIRTNRKPVSRKTIRRWNELRQLPEPWPKTA